MALPDLAVPMSAEAVLARLDEAARRGKLPGYEPGGPPGVLFRLECPGMPFEAWLDAGTVALSPDGLTLRFSTRFKPLMPWVFVAILVLSVWPGVVVTESLIASIIPGSFWRWTWWWYLPLTILSAPWAWMVAMKRSRATIAAEAQLSIDALAQILGTKPA
jgi:hypothetical protein